MKLMQEGGSMLSEEEEQSTALGTAVDARQMGVLSTASLPRPPTNPAALAVSNTTRSNSISPVTQEQTHHRESHATPGPSSILYSPPSSRRQSKRTINSKSPIPRTVTPAYSTMSSSSSSQSIDSDHQFINGYTVPTNQEVSAASEQELRDMLRTCIAANARLQATINQARTSATYHKLQYQLLGIETDGDRSRMEVEHEMVKREVDFLRQVDQSSEAQRATTGLEIAQYTAGLKARCESIDLENRVLMKRLSNAKRLIMDRDDQLESVLDDNRNYLRRIKENRQHLNRLKSVGGIYSASPQESPGYPVTPQQHLRTTPRRTPRSVSHYHHHAPLDGGQDAFSALLEADRVLQGAGTDTPPQTTFQAPNSSYMRQYSRNLDSMPTTPIRGSVSAEYSNLLPAVQLFPQSEPRYKTNYPINTPRGRKSRDSTISISDAEDMEPYNPSTVREANTQGRTIHTEQQARETPRSVSHPVTHTEKPANGVHILQSPVALLDRAERRPLPNERSGQLQQAKILGTVTKPGMSLEKRKRTEDGDQQAVTKVRVGEGIGLGIGNW